MMVDQDEIIEALKSAGYRVAAKPNVNVVVKLDNNDLIELILITSLSFPYELPEFKLSKKGFDKYGQLPHVGPTGLVCAYSRETNFANPDNPIGQVIEVLERTVEILNAGIRGENEDDYLDEFLAYWMYEQKGMLPIFSVAANLDDEPKELTVYLGNGQHNYICDSDAEALILAGKVDETNYEPCLVKCVYLPLQGQINYPFPTTHGEWLKAIKTDKEIFEYYQNFICNTTKKKSIIIFSYKYQDGTRCFAAFGHVALPFVNGFRKGKAPLELAMTEIRHKPIEKYKFVDISQKRLYQRGGIGLMTDTTIAVLGCGSLGSYLVDAFASCGVYSFILIDHECLEAENIARHLCGFSEIGQWKVDAIKKRLIADNPNVQCKAIRYDLNDVLEYSPELLSDCSCIFMTVGSYPLEKHVVKKMLENVLDQTVVLMWVEPYALAAHALVLNHPQDIYLKLFDDNARFKYQVVENGNQLYQRDAGCQSTYVQYSGLDIKNFTIEFVRNFINKKLKNNNYHFVWYGALSQSGKFDANISQTFANKHDYSIDIQRID